MSSHLLNLLLFTCIPFVVVRSHFLVSHIVVVVIVSCCHFLLCVVKYSHVTGSSTCGTMGLKLTR